MAEFIVNPRRAPRAPARCHTAVATSWGAFDAVTEDIGSRGCQVVSPAVLRRGDRIELTITREGAGDPLEVAGKVAWVSPQAPWRIGIAFEDAFVPAAETWFEKLVAETPGIGASRRVPERIPLDSTVYLGAPPKFLLDFSAEEASLLRAIGSGARLDELKGRLRDRWPAAQLALFSLLARQAVTLSRGQAAHPNAWKQILTEVEASLAVESLPALQAGARAPPPRPLPAPIPARPSAAPLHARASAAPLPTPPPAAGPPESRWGTPPLDPHPMLELGEAGPSVDLDSPAAPAGAPRASGWAAQAPAEVAGAGGGWRKGARKRSPEAQALYERGLAEIDGGNVNGAIGFLRKALALSPGDPGIAEALGKLAFKDRLPGQS